MKNTGPYLFFVLVILFIFGMKGWSERVGPNSELSQKRESGVGGESVYHSERRVELVEALDRVVESEHFFHSVYGYYTKVLNRTGFRISGSLGKFCDIRVAEATRFSFLVTGICEGGAKSEDYASIDQEYRLRASFLIPPPRPTFLEAKALRHLKSLRLSSGSKGVRESGIFLGYFIYREVELAGSRKWMAEGVKEPVLGVRLEDGAERELSNGEGRALPLEQVIDLDAVAGGEGPTRLGQREMDLPEGGDGGGLGLGNSANTLRQLSDIVGMSFQNGGRDPAQSQGRPSPRPVQAVPKSAGTQDLEIEPIFVDPRLPRQAR